METDFILVILLPIIIVHLYSKDSKLTCCFIRCMQLYSP